MIKLPLVFALIMSGQTAIGGTLDSFLDKSKLYMTTSRAAAKECLDAPVVTSDIRIQNPEITREKPSEIQHRSPTGILQGLAHMAYGFEVEFILERMRTPQGYCVKILDMKVNAGHTTPKVWLRPGLRKGSCRYKATVEHELGHVSNYHDHLRSFEAAVNLELPLMMRGKSYYKIDNTLEAATAEELLKSQAVALVRKLHERSYNEAARIDLGMDSPSEYRRLSNMCM